MKKSRLFVIGVASTATLILLCVLSPLFSRYDPIGTSFAERLVAPDWFASGLSSHPFGTDPLGRDLLTRLLYGGRTSLMISASVVSISMFIGIIVGLYAGFYGGIVDMLLMRFNDIMEAVPGQLLALCIVAVLGANVFNLVVVMSITGWSGSARLVRSSVLSIKSAEYVKSGKVVGLGSFKIIFGEVLPNCLTPIIISATQSFGINILAEAGLSFLGLGVPAPLPSLGGMISDGRAYIGTAPWIVLIPGVMLMLTVLSINFVGDGLNDILNPKNRD